jgi:cell division septation protein DedD
MAIREAELFKDKIEVTLDGRQIFYLFFGGAVLACLVFVLGVTVGRRVEARGYPPRAAAAATDPLAALDALDAQAGAELAFPAALRTTDDVPLGAIDQAAARGELRPAAKKPAAAPAVADDPPVAAAPAVAPPVAPTVAPAPIKAAPPVEAAKPSEPSIRGKYTLQLSSFQDRGEADAFAAQIKTAGYAPYVVEAQVEGKGTWFRVRVGDYASNGEALAAKGDFEAKQKIIAYVTRLR